VKYIFPGKPLTPETLKLQNLLCRNYIYRVHFCRAFIKGEDKKGDRRIKRGTGKKTPRVLRGEKIKKRIAEGARRGLTGI